MAEGGVTLEAVISLQRRLQAVGAHCSDKDEYVARVLDKLDRVPMTLEMLQQTHIGKDVNLFRKWAEPVGDKAKSLVKKWKQLVPTSEVLLRPTRPTSEVLVTPPTRPINEAALSQPNSSEVKLTLAQYQSKRQRSDHSTSSETETSQSESTTTRGVFSRNEQHRANDDGDISQTGLRNLSRRGGGAKIEPRFTGESQIPPSEVTNDIMRDLSGEGEVALLDPLASNFSPPKKRHKTHHRNSSKHSKASRTEKVNHIHERSHGDGHTSIAKSAKEIQEEKLSSKHDDSTSEILPAKAILPMEACPETISDVVPEASMDNLSSTQASAKSKRKANFDSGFDAVALSKRSRTQVYSGRKNVSGPQSVTSLFDLSMKILMDNIDAIEEVGGVPYLILEPLLQKCTASQLMRLEEYNPHFLEDSDVLWEKHCKKEFRSALRKHSQTWRDLYVDKLAEREQRLRNLTANIKAKEEKRKEPQKCQADAGYPGSRQTRPEVDVWRPTDWQWRRGRGEDVGETISN